MIPTRYNRMGLDSRHRTRWEINHGAGLLDIGIANASNLLWTFPDGSTSILVRPQKTVTAGTTVVTCDNFSANGLIVTIYISSALTGYKIPLRTLPDLRYALSTNTNTSYFTGTVSEIPRLTNLLYLEVSSVTGDIKYMPKVSTFLNLYSNTASTITGTLSDVPRVSTYLYLYNFPYITGTASDAPSVTGTKILITLPSITGALPIIATNSPIFYYGNSSVSPAEYDQTIANCVSAGGTNKILYISSRRTSASNTDKATLISRGWTVNDSIA